MGSMNLVFSLFGWTFIPDFATKHLLNFVYQRKIISVPQPGSLQHRKHYAVAFAFVIFSYLSYTIFQSVRAMPPNFYQILGVSPNVDENGLKLAFRAFAKRYHPDRPGVGREGEEMFMYVRDAFEALKDPVVRFAYDRFGPDVLGWRQHCKTPREFLNQGLMVSSGYHIVTGIALLFWSAIGRPSAVSFWRYVLFAALFAGELSFILAPFPASPSSITPASPSFFSFASSSSPAALSLSSARLPSSFLQTIFPNRIPYQHILFLHQLFMFLSVALSRVVPHFIFIFSQDGNPDGKQLDPVERAIWERVYGTLAIADREASVVLHTLLQSIAPSTAPTESQPYHDCTLARMHPLPPAETIKALEKVTPRIRDLVVEANIKNHTSGPIATAWDAALRKAFKNREIRANGTPSMAASAPALASEPPVTPRGKNFWEKDINISDSIEIVGLEEAEASPPRTPLSRPASPQKGLQRVPSTPRLSGRDSPTKAHSPIKKNFSVAAGDI